MLTTHIARSKQAELAGTTGAALLGAGVGVLVAEFAAPYAIALVALGIRLRGWGMIEKRRLESRAGLPAWSGVLFWLCRIALALLIVWIAVSGLRA